MLRLKPAKLSPDLSLPFIAEQLLHSKLSCLDNVIGTNSEILLFSNVDSASLKKELNSITFQKQTNRTHFILPICFSKGSDWTDIEKISSISKTSHITQILKTTFTLSMYGFLPGFMYLDGLPESLQIARKSKPIQKLSQGSFAIGGPYAGVYNIESPGGWHVIGNCPIRLFNSASIMTPFVKIGDTFTIKKITVNDWKKLKSDDINIKDYN